MAFEINKILGIDNTSDLAKLITRKDGGAFVREAENVDIDDEGMPHRRDGYGNIVVTSTGVQSLWSDGEVCLFVKKTSFYKLGKDFSTQTELIYNVDPTDRMSYVSVGDRVYFSNNSINGYYSKQDGITHPFTNPSQTFKIQMIGGHILEYYNSRLYSARDRILFYSDATVIDRMDYRKNAIPFPNTITMVKAVKDGIYVGILGNDDDSAAGVYFLGGNDPSTFSMTRLLDTGPIDGMSITVDGDNIGRGDSGKTVYWLASDGIYKGYPEGHAIQMQEGLYTPEEFNAGTAIYMNRNGYGQFLGIGQL